jgi:hypothetical protein
VVWRGEANMTYLKADINKEIVHHLYNELKKCPTEVFEYCRKLSATCDHILQAIQQHISCSSRNFQNTIYMEERLSVVLR